MQLTHAYPVALDTHVSLEAREAIFSLAREERRERMLQRRMNGIIHMLKTFVWHSHRHTQR